MAFLDRTARSMLLGELVAGLVADTALLLQAQGDDQLPV